MKKVKRETISSLLMGEEIGELVDMLDYLNKPGAKLVVICAYRNELQEDRLQVVHSADMTRFEVIGVLEAAAGEKLGSID